MLLLLRSLLIPADDLDPIWLTNCHAKYESIENSYDCFFNSECTKIKVLSNLEYSGINGEDEPDS